MRRLLIPLLTVLMACGSGSSPGQAPDAPVAATPPEVSFKPGPATTTVKPQGPVQIAYRIIGTPIVGQPVGIDLQVTSNVGREAVTLTYRINDPTAMEFPDAQPASVSLAPAADDTPSVQQVRVIPMREGRLYLNVSAHVETDSGTISTAAAIPIQVGAAPVRAPQDNGVDASDENGEAIKVLQGT